MDQSYWHRQTATKPLFPEIEWSKPEQRPRAGKLGIVGGNKLGFAGVAESYSTALEAGVGYVRVLLPDALKKTLPATIADAVYAVSTTSGGLAATSQPELTALGEWADGMLLIGDAGRNSETAILYEKWINDYTGPLTLSRDAVDLVKNTPRLLVERPDTIVVASFAQTQKLFQGVYYPKMLSFSMQLMQLVDALHKYTITYPCTIVTLHRETLIIAHGGDIVTQQFHEPMRIWRGDVATRIASYWLWNRDRPLQAATASCVEQI